MTQDAVKAFLYQVLGYGKIEEILKNGILPNARIRDMLEGTIFGTSKSKHGPRQALPPRIPKIYALEGSTKTQDKYERLEIKIKGGVRIYLDKNDARLNLPYVIFNASFFGGYELGEIEIFAKRFSKRLRPKHSYKTTKRKNSFTVYVKSGTFYFMVECPYVRRLPRTTTILFKTDAKTVEHINGKISLYYSRYLSSRKGKLKNEADTYNAPMDTPQDARVDSDYIPVYLEIAKKACKISPEELARELAGCHSSPYVMYSTYRVGQVLQHGSFGRGIVTEIRIDNTKKVYFPNKQKLIPIA